MQELPAVAVEFGAATPGTVAETRSTTARDGMPYLLGERCRPPGDGELRELPPTEVRPGSDETMRSFTCPVSSAHPGISDLVQRPRAERGEAPTERAAAPDPGRFSLVGEDIRAANGRSTVGERAAARLAARPSIASSRRSALRKAGTFGHEPHYGEPGQYAQSPCTNLATGGRSGLTPGLRPARGQRVEP